MLKTVTDGKNLQNFLICVEMLPAALGMLYAFPYTEYKGAGGHSACLAAHSKFACTCAVTCSFLGCTLSHALRAFGPYP